MSNIENFKELYNFEFEEIKDMIKNGKIKV